MPGVPSGYKKEYCQELIEFARTGGTFRHFAGHLEVARRTLYNWLEANPEFQEAKEIADAICEKYWIDQYRMAMVNDEGNPTMYIFLMKNLSGWRDRIEETEIKKVVSEKKKKTVEEKLALTKAARKKT